MKYKCSDCQFLDKSKKQSYGKAFRYGCGLNKDGYVATWINKEHLLDQISCSTENKKAETDEQLPGQMTIQDYLGG